MIEQSLAKYGEADVVVYIGCGERGNEMAEVLHEFPTLVDPRTGRAVMDRTVLVVNTSNMPVAARESSVYLGLTIAEYFRDMGYRVAVMADSLSRWAEALREIGARLQEMPGEEGYPTSLASRAAKFYERAGRVPLSRPAGASRRVTLISAISPPGGDFSEPVTQACLRVAGALWALDAALAHQRQFPAVDWETSYSLYARGDGPRLRPHGRSIDWSATRARAARAAAARRRAARDRELVGPEALEDRDRLLLAAAAAMREIVLGQSAFDPNDAFSPPAKTFALAARSCAPSMAAAKRCHAGARSAMPPLDDVRRALARAARCVRAAEADLGPAATSTRRSRPWRCESSGPHRSETSERRPNVSRRARGGGPLLYSAGAQRVALGEWVTVPLARPAGRRGQVIDAGRDVTVVQVLEETLGLAAGPRAHHADRRARQRRRRRELLGRALNGLGEPHDGLPPPIGEARRPIWGAPINPTRRVPPATSSRPASRRSTA